MQRIGQVFNMERDQASAPRPGSEGLRDVFVQILSMQVLRYERLFRQQSRRMEVTQLIAFITSLVSCVIFVEQRRYGYLFISAAVAFLGYFKASAIVAESFALAAHKFFLEEQLSAAWRSGQTTGTLATPPVPWDLAGGYLSRRFISGTAGQALYILSAAAIIGVSAALPWVHHTIPIWASLVQIIVSVLLFCLGALAFRDHLTSYHQTLDMLHRQQTHDRQGRQFGEAR